MAFADALTTHADVRIALVDRRHGTGGHWLDAYPFVRLHQASAFYGVASTMLGSGSIQREGPEAGLHERAGASEICAYYQRVLNARLVPSGRVEFYPNCEYVGGPALVFATSATGEGDGCQRPERSFCVPRRAGPRAGNAEMLVATSKRARPPAQERPRPLASRTSRPSTEAAACPGFRQGRSPGLLVVQAVRALQACSGGIDNCAPLIPAPEGAGIAATDPDVSSGWSGTSGAARCRS